MTRKTNKLTELKDALLSNTSFIKTNEESDNHEHISVTENTVEIDGYIYRKLKLLANHYDKTPSVLVEDAINHYLRLKRLDIDEALKNVVVGDEGE